MLPVGRPVNHKRIALACGLAVPLFAALGGLATFTTGAPLWKGHVAGALVDRFCGLMFSGPAPRLVTPVFGPREPDRDV